MKFTSIFTAVLALHLVVISVLIFQPGCTTDRNQRPPRQSEVLGTSSGDVGSGETSHSPGVPSDFNSGIAPAPARQQAQTLQPPSRPSWTLFEESSTAVQTSATTATPVPEVLQPLRPQEPALATHTVKSGDSLWRISRQYDVSLDDLLAANNLRKDSVLKVGQVLRIPGQSAVLPTAPAAGTAAVPASPVDSSTTVHTVRSGDTLSSLARQYGTTVAAIQAANGLSNTVIRVGQELVIPTAGATVTSGSTKGSAAPAAPAASVGSAQKYTVRSGDTLDAIARRFGVQVADLMRDNGITDARRLRVGQELVIPGSGTAVQKSATPAPSPAQPRPPAPSPQAPVVQEVEVQTVTVDPLELLDDVPIVQAEEIN